MPRATMANDGDSALVRDSLLFWVNALDIGNCMLVDDLAELADGRILLEIVTSLESVRVPAATTPASRAEAAIRLLGQKHGFGRLPSRLTPPGCTPARPWARTRGCCALTLTLVRIRKMEGRRAMATHVKVEAVRGGWVVRAVQMRKGHQGSGRRQGR